MLIGMFPRNVKKLNTIQLCSGWVSGITKDSKELHTSGIASFKNTIQNLKQIFSYNKTHNNSSSIARELKYKTAKGIFWK